MAVTMPHISDDERRARLAVRHALAPAHRAATPEDATRAVTALHATEPASVYLSCWARVANVMPADVDHALYATRTLVKQLAMRHTLFVFPRDLLAAVWSSASARAAATDRARMAKDIVKAGLAADGDAWIDEARKQILAVLADAPEGRPAQEIRQAVPMLDVKVTATPIQPSSAWRVITHLGATADIVRGVNTAGWHTSRPRWTLMSHWLDAVPEPLSAADGYQELVRRWLRSFGPGTEADLAWWLGSTKTVVRTALAALQAVPVTLDGGTTGWLLPDDLAPTPPPEPWAALLPVLDPTVMGWQARDFYLGPHRAALFDTRGNAGTTAWLNGRVVGCWVQDPSGTVRVRFLEEVRPADRDLLEAEAARLTAWLGGFQVRSVYSSPAMKSSAA